MPRAAQSCFHPPQCELATFIRHFIQSHQTKQTVKLLHIAFDVAHPGIHAVLTLDAVLQERSGRKLGAQGSQGSESVNPMALRRSLAAALFSSRRYDTENLAREGMAEQLVDKTALSLAECQHRSSGFIRCAMLVRELCHFVVVPSMTTMLLSLKMVVVALFSLATTRILATVTFHCHHRQRVGL